MVAFVISFFFIWCYYHCLFFEDQYFQGGVPFWRTFSKDAVFVFLYCKLFDLLWLFTPFQMSIGKKEKKSNNNNKKRSIVPTYPNPTPAPLPFLSQV